MHKPYKRRYNYDIRFNCSYTLCPICDFLHSIYGEERQKEEITLVPGLLAYKRAVRHFLTENNFTALCILLINYFGFIIKTPINQLKNALLNILLRHSLHSCMPLHLKLMLGFQDVHFS